MPKKSKQEKIRAEGRRDMFQFTSYIAPRAPEQTIANKDVTKTLMLATIAITAEFLLYWFEGR